MLKLVSFLTPEENVLFDDVLFQLADKQEDVEYLRFWESPNYFVVLGRIGREEEDVNLITTKADGIAVVRRSSGGGTVLQGPGCLNYTLVLSKLKNPLLNDLRASYEWISSKIIIALGKQGIQATFKPISDIALSDSQKKFSGNAQRRGKTHILHHGTILYNFDLDLISKYLLMPRNMPQYRNLRSHKDFVSNIYIDKIKFQNQLAAVLGVDDAPQPITFIEHSALQNYLK